MNTPRHRHEWCSPQAVVGGLNENPGVFASSSARTVMLRHVCRRCGKYREIDEVQRGSDFVEVTSYREADATSLDFFGLAGVLRIHVDYENNSRTWWDAARKSKTAPPCMRPLLGTADSVICNQDEGAAAMAWAAGLPGWDDDDAPSYAPHPLVVGEASP